MSMNSVGWKSHGSQERIVFNVKGLDRPTLLVDYIGCGQFLFHIDPIEAGRRRLEHRPLPGRLCESCRSQNCSVGQSRQI